MPETIYLTERLPLVFKAAKWLAALSSERPLDLGHYAVLVPTAGAGRRLRFEFVKAASEGGTGLAGADHDHADGTARVELPARSRLPNGRAACLDASDSRGVIRRIPSASLGLFRSQKLVSSYRSIAHGACARFWPKLGLTPASPEIVARLPASGRSLA